jgi:hypothetical protein
MSFLNPNPQTMQQVQENFRRLAAALDAGTIGGGSSISLPIAISDVSGLADALAAKLEDAPSDGRQYARKDGAWAEVVGGDSGGEAPNAPSGLTATATSSTQVNLAWTDNSTDETGFRIQRSTDGATWATVTDTADNATSYSDTGLTAETTYYYRVRALGEEANSAYTASASDTTEVFNGTSSFTSAPTGTNRSNITIEAGYQFTMASTVTITRLGRKYVTGNSQNHRVRVWNVSTGLVVADATVLASSDSDADGFKWADMTGSATLSSGVTYAIGVRETSGGDVWLDGCNVAGKVAAPFGSIVSKFGNADAMPTINGGVSNTTYSTPAMWYA